MNNLFTLADNYDLPIQKICIESIKRHNPNVKIFTKESIANLPGGTELLDEFGYLWTTHFSDIFRVWYLYNFGGFWIDADCIHLRPIEFPYEVINDRVSFMFEDGECDKLTQCLIYCPNPKDKFLEAILERQKQLLKDKGAGGISYLDLGSWSIEHIRHTTGIQPFIAPHWEYSYIPWHKKYWFTQQRHWENFQHDRGMYNPNAYCYHLTNAVIDFAKNDTREHLLSLSTFLSFLIIRAITNGFEGTRHKAILDRLPNIHQNYKYVEVGVYEGATSTIIGQQRNYAEVHCVDPWANVSSQEYKNTNDYLAHSSNEQHESHYQTFMARSWFLTSQKRLHVHRMKSEEACTNFENESVDLVYLDGDHSYEGVMKDIQCWWTKVTKGGYLGGHDYDYPSLPFGVKRAVDEFVKEKNLKLELDGDYCWFVRKE